MKKYKVFKNGVETNSWTSATGDETYYEPSFGEPGTYELSVEEFDPEALNRMSEARAYLAATDWYLVRHMETGQAVPPVILELRQEARKNAK